jgi:DNA polymerase III alpha subunit (gram-positive type)
MLDIETLGVNPGCVVLSIGAVSFNETDIFGKFYEPISIEKSVDLHKLTIEPRTMRWWMEQSPEARQYAFVETDNELDQVLENLSATFDWTEHQVWCNGASFDFPILKRLYQQAGIEVPWQFYNEMDFRTFKNLYKDLFKAVRVQPEIAHHGLYDALAQAKTLQAMFKSLKSEGINALAA